MDDASEALVLAHLDLADALARRFPSRSTDADDIRQAARLGLMKAARRFDPSRGFDFTAFATATINGELKRYVRDNGWLIRPPRRLQELFSAIRSVAPELRQRLHRPPTPEELADELGVEQELVREAIGSEPVFLPSSLDAPAVEDGSGYAERLGSWDERFNRAEAVTMIAKGCRGLSERDKRILFLRFFEDRSQAEIAAEIEVSQVQVSRLLSGILQRLRASIENGEAA
jgi:RNA polymerase sigma-B factor